MEENADLEVNSGTGSQPCSDSAARIVVASRPARDEGVGGTAALDFGQFDFGQLNFGQTTKPLSGRSTLAKISFFVVWLVLVDLLNFLF